jgi:hypothetical protein
MAAGRCSDFAECRVTFTDVTFDSFTVKDGDKPHGVHYILDQTNISCADIVYENPHPDSEVIIDGHSC